MVRVWHNSLETITMNLVAITRSLVAITRSLVAITRSLAVSDLLVNLNTKSLVATKSLSLKTGSDIVKTPHPYHTLYTLQKGVQTL